MTATVGPRAAAIRPRRVVFDWSHTPLHWLPGDPQTTHTINVLHLLLPAGEAWFVRVFRNALPLITDDRLREDVRGFMGQEAIHGRSHAEVLEHLADRGLDPAPYLGRVDWLFDRLLGDQPFGRTLGPRAERLWLIRRLALIAAIEHFTAVLGIWVVDSPGLDDAGADPVMLDLLRWHGSEEVEHRSVAYDLFQHVSGSYPQRVIAMATASAALTILWFQGVRFFMRHDPTDPGRPSWRAAGRAMRLGRLPSLRSLLGAIPEYLRPRFHPSLTGDTEGALDYLATSPAVLAARPAAS